jgi:hypothetical protein
MSPQVTPPNYLPDDAVAWAQANQHVLELLVEELLRAGSWPQLNPTTRKLAREGRPIALDRLLSGMPKPLGFIDHDQGRHVVLLLHGLRMTHSGSGLLAGFAAALAVARTRYAAEDESEPTLGRADIAKGRSNSDPYVRALGEILVREAPFLGGGRGDARDDWSREVTANIVPYWEVTDADDYLRIRAEELRMVPQFGRGVPLGASATPASTGSSLDATRDDVEPVNAGIRYSHDIFISHAGEDKDVVARPLAHALTTRGKKVWLDELELAIGDSLSRRIDDGLLKSRFGVVILSPAFFSKEWPQRELAGLAAREIDTGVKVILPVWHDVDHHFVAGHSPVLADRLGVSTGVGIEGVADAISQALTHPDDDQGRASPKLARDLVPSGEEEGAMLFTIPTSDEEQARLIAEKPDWWEYRLYAGVLMQGRIALERKWRDHELRLPRGSWQPLTGSVFDFLSRETGPLRRQMGILDRLFEPKLLERAFGPPLTAGDPELIAHIARGVTQSYESMLDWASELRRTTVAAEHEELLELTARMADGPVGQIREFIQTVADQIARVPVLLQEAAAKGATTDSPMALDLILHVELDPDNQRDLQAALDRLR